MTDEELYSRYLAGGTASYDELLIRLGNGLIVYINGYLHNLQDSEDLMIEAFARIMAKRPHIRGSFKAYLYRTARNLAFRFCSSASRTKTFSIEDVGGEITDGSFPETSRVLGQTISRKYNEAAVSFDLYDLLGSYPGPVLILHGDQDPIVPLRYSERAARVFPHAQLVVMPGQGHGFMGQARTEAMEREADFFLGDR